MKTNTRACFFTVLLLSPLLLAGCYRYRTEHLHVKAWKAPASYRPGADTFPELGIEAIRRKENIGIAFTGGGNRAAVATLGQLRALDSIGLLSRVRYISSVSGGTWCAGPYSFLQKKAYKGYKGDNWVKEADKDFFGEMIPPGDLDPVALTPTEATKGVSKFVLCAQNSTFDITRLFKMRGDKNWAFILSAVYLKPLKISKEHKFIAYDVQSAQEFLDRNKDDNLDLKHGFETCPPGRPYLIAGASLVHPFDFDPKSRYFPMEITPNYIGTRARFPLDGTQNLGGGYVESAGYDTRFERVESEGSGSRPWIVASHTTPRKWPAASLASPRFALADLLATSGAAPTVPMPELANIVGFPKFHHWAPGSLGTETPRTFEKIHTDGGGTDDSGVAALVARGVPRVIAFINSAMTLDAQKHPILSDDVTSLFGARASEKGKEPYPVPYIFEKGQFNALEAAFERVWKDDASPVVTMELTTRANAYYRIPAGRKVRITWVFLGPPQPFTQSPGGTAKIHVGGPGSASRWYRDLNPATVEKITNGKWKDEFSDFPYYKTFFQASFWDGGIVRVISLTPEQVNALSQFTSYVVMQNKEKILQ